jgi:hypothetical protein
MTSKERTLMKFTGRFATLALVASCLVLSTAFAQSAPPAQPAQDQAQTQTQPPATGISHPPADDTIQADEDAPPPVVAPAPKPSAAVPITPATPVVITSRPSDPDYGMVTSVSGPVTTTASLTKRPFNPDDDMVNVVPTNPNELASGTNIRVRLSQGLSTTETRSGERFRAVVDKDVYNEGRVIIPAGAEMRGRVVAVSQGHHLGPHATIRLRPETIMLPDGSAYHLYAEAVQSKAPGTRTDEEGGIQAAHHYKKDALEYGAGTGAGAIAGAEIGGPVGAGVGSLVGAGVVTAHLLMAKPAAANLPQGAMLTFSLTEPMELTPTRN